MEYKTPQLNLLKNLTVALLLLTSVPVFAQYTEERQHDTTTENGWSKLGSGIKKEDLFLGVDYGITINPSSNPVDLGLIGGYRFNDKVSAGVNLNYLLYGKLGFTKYESGFGGGIFARAFLGNVVFFHAQANYMNLVQIQNFQRVRESSPIFLVGGGYKRGGFSIDNSSYSYVSILFQANYKIETSPYFIPVILKGGFIF
ncbi:MAG: hypothetical protein EXR21_02025 [Flavobacteriaceae bacterium]|nr:hypothetical protein [Flavobacteriaceae bacterium]